MPYLGSSAELHDLGHPLSSDADCAFGSFSFDGTNGAIMRTKDGKYTLQEDTCRDTETAHIDEDVSMLIVPNCATMTDNIGAGVSGDPFVVSPDGEKVQFFLPLHQEVMLLQCKEMELFGTSFGSGVPGDHQQWFDTFRVVVGGTEELVVSIAKNSTEVHDDVDINAGMKKDGVELTTLKVVIEGVEMKRTGAVGTEGGNLIAVWHSESVETVQVSVGNIVLQLKSAVAQKFDKEMQRQLYTHLDLRFVELKSHECTKGVLAEIWGVVAMSESTARMLEPPKH
jgi:hypothetical protein